MAWLTLTYSLVTDVQHSCHSKTDKTSLLVLMDAVELVVLVGNQYRQQELLLVPQENGDWKKGAMGWVCIMRWVCNYSGPSPPFLSPCRGRKHMRAWQNRRLSGMNGDVLLVSLHLDVPGSRA